MAATSGKVVILIDEYDKPILGNIDNPQVDEILKILKAFYSVVKTAGEYIRFAFLTGVSKFSKVSVFSDLNNLTDLTMDGRYAALAGYTQQELEVSFSEYIDRLAENEAVSRPEILEEIRKFYNGYRFSDEKITVYNPVSCGKLFDTQNFGPFLLCLAGCSLFNMGSNDDSVFPPSDTKMKVALVDFKLVLPLISNAINRLVDVLKPTGCVALTPSTDMTALQGFNGSL